MEKQIQDFWESGFLIGKPLETTDKIPLKILSAGVKNKGKGADFLEAEIQLDKKIVRGEVEIHKNSKDWNSHQHFTDANYNNVILHVVACKVSEVWTENGKRLTTLSLFDFLENELKITQNSYPCTEKTAQKTSVEILKILEKQAEIRIEQKFLELKNEFANSSDFTTLLYEKMAQALGYSKNQVGMLRLAKKLPLSLLRGVLKSSELPKEQVLRLIFRETAGFLSENLSRIEQDFLENFRKTYKIISLKKSDWNFFQVRPGNQPQKRIEILVGFVQTFLEETYLEHLLKGVLLFENPKELNHFCLDYFSPKDKILGKNRKETLVLNVLVPVLRLYAEQNNEENIFTSLKMLVSTLNSNEKNAKTTELLKRLKLNPELEKFLEKSAFYQQGLLHVAKNYCFSQKQNACPFSE
ncbi:DUF2851 family protein [bacterium]|nr:DUF2851 family protein [bacterium]